MSDWVGILIILISLFCGGFALGVKWGGEPMRAIDADRLIDDLKHDVVMDQDSLDYEELTDSNREKIQFDKDCKQNAIDLLQNAPTIEPERKTGRWIYDEERCATGIYAICSACDESIYQTGNFRYCPNCGARMMEGEG